MGVIFKTIFFLVRVPFFLIGIWLWTFISPFVLIWFLLVVPIFGIPIAFLGAAFSNSPRAFAESLKDGAEMVGDGVGGAFRPYGSMFFWMLGVEVDDYGTKTWVGVAVVFCAAVLLSLDYILQRM